MQEQGQDSEMEELPERAPENAGSRDVGLLAGVGGVTEAGLVAEKESRDTCSAHRADRRVVQPANQGLLLGTQHGEYFFAPIFY